MSQDPLTRIFDMLEQKSDDELLELMISAPIESLLMVKLVWNKRHPEDKVPV